jgi:hypothetical protein
MLLNEPSETKHILLIGLKLFKAGPIINKGALTFCIDIWHDFFTNLIFILRNNQQKKH